MTLADLLGTGSPDDVVVHFEDRSWTRGQITERAGALADALEDLGVVAGEPVAVSLQNGPDVVAALFGVWRFGGVYAPINPRLTDSEARQVLDAVAPAAVLTDQTSTSRWGEHPMVLTGEGSVTSHPGSRGAPARHGPEVALIQFTSGTTGRPKPVVLLHSGILTLLDGVLSKLQGGTTRPAQSGPATKAPMPNLVPVSLSLWAGIYNVVFALRAGAPVVLMSQFDPVGFADLVGRFAIRSTVLPPAAMAMLTDTTAVEDLSPLRFVRSISAPLSPLQARRFHERFGVAVLNGYGQTEIGGEIIGWSAADWREHGVAKLGAVGRAHEAVSVRTDAGTGELQVRTPAMSAGYADGTDLSDRLSPDGWFRTGDIATIDDDGFVWIEGRMSDMINRGGLKVFPGEVEEVIRLVPGVADVAVVGVPDERLGEVPCAFVVAAVDLEAPGPPDSSVEGASRDGDRTVDLTPDHLESVCRENLAPYKVPVRFQRVTNIPRNEIGKVLPTDLRAMIS